MKARLLRGALARALVVALAAASGGVFALWRAPGAAPRTAGPSVAAAHLVAPASSSSVEAALLAAERACLAKRAELLRAPGLELPPSAAGELRAQLLGRTKAAPVLFLSRPDPLSEPPLATTLRKQLEAEPGYEVFGRVVGKVRSDPALARAVFLQSGYLYTESPELAVLYGTLTLSLLYREPALEIVRGAEQLRAKRLDDGDYEYTSGPERGKRAKLLLFDRVAVAGASAGPQLHVDLRALAEGLGFDELAIERATAERLAVQLVYGELRVPALLSLAEGSVALECEAPGERRAELLAYRAGAVREAELQARVLEVVREQVDEALPFDEPKTEDGQQDGKLRPEWRTAYLNGRSSFEFNGDRYAVFDASGRPRPPQVCIDFVLDTFERASGTWWRPVHEQRARILGRLRFEDAAMENQRSVERFIEFAREHASDFDVFTPAPEDRPSLRNRQQFFSSVYRSRQHYRRGDIVAILGPREDEKLHYHSFIIVARDPLSGMPTELAANAGRPRIRSWEGEMSNAPRRSILARIRPRAVWLESFLSPESAASADVPPPGPSVPTAG